MSDQRNEPASPASRLLDKLRRLKDLEHRRSAVPRKSGQFDALSEEIDRITREVHEVAHEIDRREASSLDPRRPTSRQ